MTVTHSHACVLARCVFLGRFFARAFEITECKLMKMTANESVNEEAGEFAIEVLEVPLNNVLVSPSFSTFFS